MIFKDNRYKTLTPDAVTWSSISDGAVFAATVRGANGIWLKLGTGPHASSLFRIDVDCIHNRFNDLPEVLLFTNFRELNATITVTDI